MNDSRLTVRQFARTLANKSLTERKLLIKEYLRSISDLGSRDEADSFFIQFPDGDDGAPETVIIFIHGINTVGEWQDRIADQFREEHGMHAYPIGYGVVDIIRFIFPFGTRGKFVRIVDEKLRAVMDMHPNAQICVAAHSFGTYIITRLIRDRQDLRLDKLLMCGSVVPLDFSWRPVLRQLGKHRVVNEVGTRDIWPIFAGAVTFGYGPSGTLGFKYPGVRDRFHDYKHSDYFFSDHVNKYWKPFFLDGRIIPSEYTQKREKPGLVAHFFCWFPTNYIVWSILIFVLCYFGFKEASHFLKFLSGINFSCG